MTQGEYEAKLLELDYIRRQIALLEAMGGRPVSLYAKVRELARELIEGAP